MSREIEPVSASSATSDQAIAAAADAGSLAPAGSPTSAGVPTSADGQPPVARLVPTTGGSANTGAHTDIGAGSQAEAASNTHGHPAHCANCEALLTGHYCSRCGQRAEHEIHSVWHFTQEATEDLTHADSRLWSTLKALLFKPGFLTQEFLAGRRVRYLPPLRLYLVLSVLFFLVIGASSDQVEVAAIHTGNGHLAVTVESPESGEDFRAKPGETPEQREQRVCTVHYNGPLQSFIAPFVRKSCHNLVKDGASHNVLEAFMHNLSRAMFIFVPALAVVMKLMYWRPRRYYVEHLLFFVHTHAFAFLLFGLLTMIERVLPNGAAATWLSILCWIYLPVYLFMSLRTVYGQGRWRTFFKLIVLSFGYFAGAVMTLLITGAYSVYSV